MKNDSLLPIRVKYDFTLIVVLCMGAVLVSYALEYFLGLKSCRLCGIERYAYKAGALIGIIGYFFSTRSTLIVALKYALLLTFSIGAAVSLYHSAIQHGWVAQPSFCEVPSVMSNDPDQVKAMLLATDMLPPCNQVTFRFLTLSLAEWNILLSFLFIALTTRLLKIKSA